MIGAMNKYQIDHLLRGELVGRIGCSVNRKTYVVPITYVYDGEAIYAHTREGHKIMMMRENPEICFEVDRIDNLANWQSVIIQGHYEELKGKKADEALQLIVNRVHPFADSETLVPKHGLERHATPVTREVKMVVFKIRIHEATGRFEKQ